mgnify:CR=1 FL=1
MPKRLRNRKAIWTGLIRKKRNPALLVLLEGPQDYIFRNIRERQRAEEKEAPDEGSDLPEGLKDRLAQGLQDTELFTVTWTDST